MPYIITIRPGGECNGYTTQGSGLLHDGGTCPVHEAGTRRAVATLDGPSNVDSATALVAQMLDNFGVEGEAFAVAAAQLRRARSR